MPRAVGSLRRKGRRGRRTAFMIRSARERIAHLFGLAEVEWGRGHASLSDRYVGLARRVGSRYNVRIPSEYRELYCRRCSAFWAEGRTVRTRLRASRRVRTCLRCQAIRRSPSGPAHAPRPGPDSSLPSSRQAAQEVMAAEPSETGEEDGDLDFSDEE
ncbi:MAG: hypothetical protein L3J93_02935 [Thermoplasmata archaeon]|nr:hypothetical protein [Thermoplasmata archaeon]